MTAEHLSDARVVFGATGDLAYKQIAVGMRVMRPGVAFGEVLGQDKELLACRDPALETMPYERLLDEAMRGDQTLFAREDEIEAQWRW